MTDDDIRYVLSAYAAHAPDLDARRGLAERLARRDRVRRAAVAGVACLAAVVAVGGVVALTGDRGTAALVAADDPSPSPSPAPEPSDHPTVRPSPAVTPSASPATTEPPVAPSASAASASPSPAPPPLPGPPISDSGRGAEGLRAEVVLTPGSGPTATRMVLALRARDDDGQPQVIQVTWGDSRSESIAMMAAACPGPPTPAATPRPPAPGELDEEYRHAWRHDGRYTVTVVVGSATYCADPPAEPERVTLTLDVVVTGGVVTSNGPARPGQVHFSVGPEPEGELYSYLFEASLRDEDGWTRTATIDWGDGSPRTTFRPDEPCDDGDGRHYPTGWLTPHRTHRYQPGRYTVTVTWESSGCDGGDVQRTTKSVELDVESVD